MEAYIVPDWVKIIAGLVIYQRQPESRVLLGLRSARLAAGQWCLPTGLGAIRRDASSVLAAGAPASLENPVEVIQRSGLSERQRQAFFSPAGFALAEAKWYIEIPFEVRMEQLEPLKPICELDGQSLLVKIYFGLQWPDGLEAPFPAKTEWPFKEVRFLSRGELKDMPIAFGCDKDLDDSFWPLMKW